MAFERIAPDTPEWAAYYANHIQRYMFAADRVVAADRDAQALDVARARFARAGVTPVPS
jgi:hypothetical protein